MNLISDFTFEVEFIKIMEEYKKLLLFYSTFMDSFYLYDDITFCLANASQPYLL